MKKGLEGISLMSASVGVIALLLASPVLGQGNPRTRIQIPGGGVRIPINRLGGAAQLKAGVVDGKAPKVDIQRNSPDIQVLRRTPVATQNFSVADPQTGAPISPTTILTLPDGRKVEAGTYYTELNKIEKGLNDLGYSLRTMPRTLVLQKSVVNPGVLQQQAAQFAAIGPRLADVSLTQRFLAAPVVAGGQRVLMSGQLTAEAAQSIRNQNVGKSLGLANNELRLVPQTGVIKPQPNGIKPRIGNRIKILPRPGIDIAQFKSPKIFHREQPWNWSVGNPSSFQAYLSGKLVTDGKAYPVANPSDAEIFKSASEYTLSGDAQAGGSILGRNVTLLAANAKFYAPSNTAKPLNANSTVQVIGITVYNFNQDIPTNWDKSDTISQSLHYGVPFGIQLGPIWLGGEIGANGEAGLKYSVSMSRTGVGGNVTPFIHTNVYGEGGASVVVAGAGVAVQMTLINADLDMYGQARLGWFLKWIFFQDFYVGYKVRMLDGRVYGYVYVYVPKFGIPPWEKKQWEHDFWNWSGFGREGTLVNYDNTLVFDDWDNTGMVATQ
ncbi:hypothetical protein IAD21_06382 [Abditibacteriota bacterium]|nr:hypothetical protein IAD21_06382 [Abditibacteriota bacterium]